MSSVKFGAKVKAKTSQEDHWPWCALPRDNLNLEAIGCICPLDRGLVWELRRSAIDRSFFLKSCFPRITFLSMICVPFSLMFRFISFSISDLAALGSLVWDFDLLSFAGCHGLFISFVSSCILYHFSVAECIDSGTLSANVGSPRGRLHGVCRVEQERSLPWNDWRWEAGNGFLREMIRASFGCTSVISTNLPQLVTHHWPTTSTCIMHGQSWLSNWCKVYAPENTIREYSSARGSKYVTQCFRSPHSPCRIEQAGTRCAELKEDGK